MHHEPWRRARRPMAILAFASMLAGAMASGAQAQDGPIDQPPGAEKLDPAAPEVMKRAHAARVKTIAEMPPAFWHEVYPDLLKDVTLERLRTEKGAVVIVRAYAKSPDGDEIPFPYVYTLREVNTDRVRVVFLRKRGSMAQLGWGVAVVPPGRYVPTGVPAKVNIHLQSDGTLAHKIRLPLGSARIAIDKGVRVEAGEVVYLGTEVDSFAEKKPPPRSIQVLDESAAARAYAQAELPSFAPHLQTRLLPSVDPVELQ
ncbi:hypothetical protein [Xanthobacter pseudotagetidis]|uniref:hypothetical protein n=1 Tax=Xanthobacter pseudotagetidis TaxID=3119911 RepID=UPI00372A87E3